MQSDSNGTIILKSLIVIALCIGGFSIMLSCGGIIGIIALLGSALIGYSVFNNPFKNCDVEKIKSISKKYIFPSFLIIVVLGGAFFAINKTIIQPKIKENNIAKFKEKYEESLRDVLEANSWELISIEYPELVPDKDKDYYEIDRINEYDVFVYVKGAPLGDKEMYDAIIDIRCNNKYLLSNTYKLLSEGAYVDDDCKETGFHQVNTILVFDNNAEYQIDFRSLLKNNEVIYKQSGSSGGSSNVYPYGNECGYPECDHNRADGKPYCHQHSCGESGCNNPTDLLPSYCDQHNCTYGSCSAPRYKAAGSTYCQRHYIENN